VTGDLCASNLVRSGLPASERESKRVLFDAVLHAFDEYSTEGPTHAWWVPGRIEVFGKHTDYCGGHSLVGTVPRGFALVASARTDCRIRMLDARRKDRFEMRSVPPDDITERELTGWRNYASVVVRRLARNFQDAFIGADIVFASDLPSAAGMSSSSALMVGLATAIVTLAKLDERPEWRDNIRNPEDRAGYYACIENGMSFGSLAGDSGVGTHGGSEDHIAILCGVPGDLSAWSFVPIRRIGTSKLPDDWTLVIAASGVAADKTGTAKESYNRLSREARALLDLWNDRNPHQPSLRATLVSSADAAEGLRSLILASGVEAGTQDDLDRRLTHFLREDARVLEAMEAVRSADVRRMTLLADSSQADAETLLRNQVSETVALARMARDLGAFAASSFGAGFGGSVWALIDRDVAAGFQERWLETYRRQFPSRSNATTFVARPGPPLTRLV
jgi:galactokinase